MPHDFVVLATVRSGSYHLCSLLDSAPDLTCYGEMYKQDRIEVPAEELATIGYSRGDWEKRNARGAAFLEDISALAAGRGQGFKLFPAHMREHDFLLDAILDSDRRILALLRPMLEIAVSLKVADATGNFVRRDPASPPSTRLVEMTEADVTRGIGIWAAIRKRLAVFEQAIPDRVQQITYAELDQPAQLTRLLRHLGSEATGESLSSRLLRQSSVPLQARVSNWDALVEHMTSRPGLLRHLKDAGYGPDDSAT